MNRQERYGHFVTRQQFEAGWPALPLGPPTSHYAPAYQHVNNYSAPPTSTWNIFLPRRRGDHAYGYSFCFLVYSVVRVLLFAESIMSENFRQSNVSGLLLVAEIDRTPFCVCQFYIIAIVPLSPVRACAVCILAQCASIAVAEVVLYFSYPPQHCVGCLINTFRRERLPSRLQGPP